MIVLSIISVSYFLLDRSQLIFTFIVLLTILSIQVAELIGYLSKTNREFYKFLLSLKHSDFQIYYPESGTNKSLDQLHATFNSIIDVFKEVKIEKESQYEFLRLIVEQVKIGIISINGSGEIILMNSFAEHLLGSYKTKTWDQLTKKQSQFCQEINNISKGGNRLIELKNNIQLSVHVNKSILLNEPHQIISFQDIKNEIENKETDAWIRLIRILNHEIMNSVTPISSLTETILLILESEDKQHSNQQIEDVISCVKTIQKRSNGLFDFVTEYRKLTKIPSPKKETIFISDFFENIKQLWKGEIDKKQILFKIEISNEAKTLEADPHLMDQVFINLIKNSIQALENVKMPEIKLSALMQEGKSILKIADNGVGIPQNLLNDIFVPFYTTKEKGSGIGLSLSRQIMRMHGGNIKVSSIPNQGAIFSIEFNIL
jgi:two-component system, NtrC family, nitrogen regulation sensor histidine kinase NtrY